MKQSERESNREQWRAEVEAWRASGKRLSTWARERSLSRDALEYWKRRLPAPRRSPLPAIPARPLTLIPIRPALPAVVGTAPIELVTDARPGLRIRLPASFDAVGLARLLAVLESRC